MCEKVISLYTYRLFTAPVAAMTSYEKGAYLWPSGEENYLVCLFQLIPSACS